MEVALRALPIIALLVTLPFGPAAAEPELLRGQQIAALLTDATATGNWSHKAYRQFFSADGVTEHRPEDGPPRFGLWKIEDDRYCSNWSQDAAPSEWNCILVLREGDTLYWQKTGHQPQAFTLESGRTF